MKITIVMTVLALTCTSTAYAQTPSRQKRAQADLRHIAKEVPRENGTSQDQAEAEAIKQRVEQTVAKAEFREWTVGKAKFKAKFLWVEGKVAVMYLPGDVKKVDLSRVMSYPLAMLSPADQTWINAKVKAEQEAAKKSQREKKRAEVEAAANKKTK